MAKFKDCLGREWSLRITTRLLRPLREAGFDVGACAKGAEGYLPLADPETLGRVLWVFCEQDAKGRDIDEDGFAGGFDGPTIHAATTALMGAVADFTQTPTVAAAMKKKLPGAIAAREAEIVRRIEQSGPTGSIASAGKPADSPASTPAT